MSLKCLVCLRPAKARCGLMCRLCIGAFDRWNASADGTHAALIAWAAARARRFERRRMRKGVEGMREACMQSCRDALRDPSDIAIIGRVADAIRALPLDAPGAEGASS